MKPMISGAMKAAWLMLAFLTFITNAIADDHQDAEPLANRINELIKHEAISLDLLLQTGLAYSLNDDDFFGGRGFEAANARIGLHGSIDGGFFYKVQFNLVNEPNLLDAFIGYYFHEGIRVSLGAMKPRQTQDYIPHPGATDFITRANITGLLVQSREVGVAAEGDIGGFYYYAGLFNGTRLANNNDNNKFYGIGRLQYTFPVLDDGMFRLGVNASHGESPGVTSGSFGPVLRGKRSIYGGDARLEARGFMLAAEYLAGQLELMELPNETELITGYYLSSGYWFTNNFMALARWQSWGYDVKDFRDHQFTIGTTHLLTSLKSLLINFDAYFPENGDAQYGFLLGLQVLL